MAKRSSSEQQEQLFFSTLQPLCVDLINTKQQPSKEKLILYLQKLNEIFSKHSIDKSDTNNNSLIDYLLLPVLIHLNNATSLSLNHHELLFNIVSSVINNLSITKMDLFMQILNKSTFIVSSQLQSSSTQKVYDEYLESFMTLMRTLFQRFNKIGEFYVLANLPTIGLLVSMLLDIVTRIDTTSVRLNAIDTLTVIINLDSSGEQEYEQGTILATFLPGISIKMIQNFLFQINLSVVNHKLICNTIELLRKLFGCVLNDQHIEVLKKEVSQKGLSDNVKALVIDRARNIDWVRNTRNKLKILLEQLIAKLIKHDSYQVRLKLNEFCDYLLCQTSYSILTSKQYSQEGKQEDLYFINRFLNLFLVNSMDDCNDLVREAGERSITALKRRLENDESVPTLYQLCSDNLESILHSREETLSFKLKLIYAYLNLINTFSSLSQFYLSNTNTIKKLLQVMISNIKFNYQNLNNLYIKPTLPAAITSSNESEEIESGDESEVDHAFSSDITKLTNYKGLSIFFEDENLDVSKQIDRIAKLFGMNLIITRLVCDLVLTDESYSGKRLNELIYIFKSILEGMAVVDEDDEKYSIIKYLLEILIKSKQNEQQQEVTKLKQLAEQNYDIINNCLSLELLSCTSKCLKVDKFKQMFLLDILYFILKQYQNENLLIKVFSYKCLDELSVNLGFKDIRALLSSNYDYIINSLYVGMFHANTQQSYLLVLCSLITICDVDIVSYLQQIIETLFGNLEIRLYHDDMNSLKLLCYMLVYLSGSIKKWYKIKSSTNSDSIQVSTGGSVYKQLIDEIDQEIARHKQEFMNMHKEKEESGEQEEAMQEDEEEGKENKETKLPNEIKIQLKCLEICQHLISYPNKQICLLVIEIVKNFSVNLVNLEHKSELLPLLHKLWPPLIKQFSIDTSDKITTSGVAYQINIKLIRLVFTLISISDTFLIKRFNEDFLPQLLEFMQKQSKISYNYKQRGDTTYTYSNGYKLQVMVLKYLPKIYSNREMIDEFSLEMILKHLLVPYLDKRQPMKLQNLAIDACRSFSEINSDIIWFYIHLIVDLAHEDQRYSKQIKFKYSNLMLENQTKLELINLYEKL